MTPPRILVVDDEAPIRRFLRASLQANGLEMLEATDVRSAIVQVTERPPDAVVLDLGLPDGDGIDFVRQVRSWSKVPILVLSARDQEQHKVAALDAGADDYLTKPFSMPELLARLRVALRRATPAASGEARIAVGDATDGFDVDLAARIVHRRRGDSRDEVRLTPNEYRLLAVLARHADKVLTHSFLLRECWGPGHEGDFAYLRVYMAQLRQKLEVDPAQPRWLLTELAVGYRLRRGS